MPSSQRERVRPVAREGEKVYYTSTLGRVETLTQRKARNTNMRLTGTGKDPEGRYSEGLIFDAIESEAASYIEKGWATATPVEDDPGRTESQLAAAAIRGDSLADPADRELAEKAGLVDEYGAATAKAFDVVHEEKDALNVEPAATTPVRQAESSGHPERQADATPAAPVRQADAKK